MTHVGAFAYHGAPSWSTLRAARSIRTLRCGIPTWRRTCYHQARRSSSRDMNRPPGLLGARRYGPRHDPCDERYAARPMIPGEHLEPRWRPGRANDSAGNGDAHG